MHPVIIAPLNILISFLLVILRGRSVIRFYNRFLHIRKMLWGKHAGAHSYFVDMVCVSKKISDDVSDIGKRWNLLLSDTDAFRTITAFI
ncbi:TPA: hypothetical protein ACYZYW_004707 [Escherichia coli]|uniref:hypothetical protein n=1 Tax=Escherichia coli TaxID=562 RepID=UPI000FAC9E59|nr:hypothetical protein [Escherichia coli]EEV6167521.1 hypothetical protein [Escherichia coli]EEV6942940.1 hypothetical protein [Escherichia coli]EEV8731973.1 hypothetical protein [Escherichia coli]EEV9039032.1 hypothetical protein [Escherichia coli]